VKRPVNPDDFMGWPEACSTLGLANAVRAASSGHLAVFGLNGRHVVTRANVTRLRGISAPRQRGDVLPPLTPDLGPRR
jgi:hypothetical protein